MNRLLEVLGLDEPPMGVFYTDVEPEGGVSPKAQTPVSREAEEKGEVDWMAVQQNFSCVLGKVWQARKKRTAAQAAALSRGSLLPRLHEALSQHASPLHFHRHRRHT